MAAVRGAPPNKRTALINAAIAAQAASKNRSPLDVLLAIMRNPDVAMTTRVEMALEALPHLHAKTSTGQARQSATEHNSADLSAVAERAKSRAGKSAAATAAETDAAADASDKMTDLMPLDFLLAVMRAPQTPAAQQAKLALATMPYVHPKQTRGPKKPPELPAVPDRHGFVVEPAFAKKFRNQVSRLARLARRRSTHPQEYKMYCTPLLEQIEADQAMLQCPCPSRYSIDDAKRDRQRLEQLMRKRDARVKLTEAEDAEHAHITARYAAFKSGPEARARERLAELRERARWFRNLVGPPLTAAEKSALRGLTTLYPIEPISSARFSAGVFFPDLDPLNADRVDEVIPASD